MTRLFQRLFSSVQSSSVRGSVAVESAIVLPFLLFLTLGAVDLARAVNQYLLISRVAYEGARYAATVPGLPLTGICSPSATPAEPCNEGLELVRQRINGLMHRHGFNAADYAITTRSSPAQYTQGEQDRAVSVELSASFHSKFIPLQVLGNELGTKVIAPYLFPDQASS